MIFSLRNHPFAVRAHFDKSLVLTYAAPAASLRPLLPDCLELDTFQGRWGFAAIAFVSTRQLRPSFLPAWMGLNALLAGYRIFVKYRTAAGRRLRGLYILKTETNRRPMAWLGNLFTQYHHQVSDITESCQESLWGVESRSTGYHITTARAAAEAHVPLPSGSPFASWAEARRFAGPMPFTFSHHPASGQVVIVEGKRSHWKPMPAAVDHYPDFPIDSIQAPGLIPASAFSMEHVDYEWRKGRIESWPR
ncbi:MAG: hypothetical protein JWL81_1877 [Verrucomicrobiales bacterium]|nr:hypothetical protein [Verrucomicrobiales bacterium]